MANDIVNVNKQINFNSELFNKWIASLDTGKATAETYSRAIRQFFYYLTAREICKPKRSDIIAYRESLKKTHKPNTVQIYLMAVKQFFKWLDISGLYPDISKGVKGAGLSKNFKKDYLTKNQIRAVLSVLDGRTLKDLRNRAIILLMLTTGLRTMEVSSANIGDFNTFQGLNVLYIQGKGKDGKNEYVKLTKPVKDALDDYLIKRGQIINEEAPLFSSTSHRNAGERLTAQAVSRIVKLELKKAKIESERITAHSLRHTAAVINLLNGGTLEETKILLRHSSIDTTTLYTHAIERVNNNSEERITTAILGI